MSDSNGTIGLVSITLGDATFGVPVLQVQDVVSEMPLNRVPLAPPEVAGVLNLRGRIVTAIDMRRRLGLGEYPGPRTSVIVERKGEFFALLVDDVGDVHWLEAGACEALPVTLCESWRSVCSGLYRLDETLLLVLDIEAALTLQAATASAA